MPRPRPAFDPARVLRELAALPEASMRRAALQYKFSLISVEEAAALMEKLWRRLQAEPTRCAPLIPFFRQWREYLEALPYETRQELYEVAVRRQFRGLQRAFLSLKASPCKRKTGGGEMPDPFLDQLTVGEKRALARSRGKLSLKRLLSDDSPLVIAALLENPLLTLSDVLKLASRRPANPKCLAVLYRHPRWNSRIEVRRALLLNPWTPRETAEQLAACLSAGELRKALALVGTDAELRERIRGYLKVRKTS